MTCLVCWIWDNEGRITATIFQPKEWFFYELNSDYSRSVVRLVLAVKGKKARIVKQVGTVADYVVPPWLVTCDPGLEKTPAHTCVLLPANIESTKWASRVS